MGVKYKMMPFILLLLFILTSACEYTKEGVKDSPEGQYLEKYLETMKLPDHFSVTFDPTKVKSVNSAKIYTASQMEIEKDKAKKELLHGKIVKTKNYAEGLWFKALDDGVTEYLIVNDGGESLDMNSGVTGGFTYSRDINGVSFWTKLSKVIGTAPGPPGTIAQTSGYTRKSDYGSTENLSFMDYSEALSKVKNLLNAVECPKLKVAETYSLDMETMKKHYAFYKKHQKKDAGKGKKDNKNRKGEINKRDENDEFHYSRDNEAYLFFFEQIIDGIPLSNVNWQEKLKSTSEITVTSVSVFYTKDGARNMIADHLFNVGKGTEAKSLISGTSALKTLVDSYSGVLHDKETKVISMELNYVAILTKDKEYDSTYKLVPAWIFTMAQPHTATDPRDGSKSTYDIYSHYVVNAVTGDEIKRASNTGETPTLKR